MCYSTGSKIRISLIYSALPSFHKLLATLNMCQAMSSVLGYAVNYCHGNIHKFNCTNGSEGQMQGAMKGQYRCVKVVRKGSLDGAGVN